MNYEKINTDGTKVYSNCKVIELNGMWISNPTAEQIAEAGWVEHEVIINDAPEEPSQEEKYLQMLSATEEKWAELIENYFAANGEGEIKTLAEQRKEIRYQLDQLGKIVQTTEGTGQPFDPYKTWMEGMSVNEGEWWQTYDNHIWEAIKTGVPSSSIDAEYWDTVDYEDGGDLDIE